MFGSQYWVWYAVICSVAITAAGAEDCSEGCTCSYMTTSRRHQTWLLGQSSYRLQWMLMSDKRRHSKDSSSDRDDVRQMMCIGVDKIPDYIPQDIRKLTIYGESERPVYKSRDSFSGHIDWDQLVDLTAPGQIVTYNHSELTTIKKTDLEQASHLSELNIQGNQISSLSSGAFRAMHFLKKLSLRENGMKSIPPYTFNGLDNIETIDLSRNQLTFLSDVATRRLPKLKILLLNRNQLEDLYGTDFSHTESLEELDLSHNKIGFVDFRTFEPLKILKKLNLDGNRISYVLNSWFVANEDLQWLSFADNTIDLVEGGSFSSLTMLEHLDLSGNRLSSLDPPMFEGLGHIKSLDLSRNNLMMIETGTFLNTPHLRELDLASNMLNHLGKLTFDGLQALDSLDLSQNKIEQLNNTDLIMFWNLTSLDLSNNRINRIKAGTFQDMQNLREIHLNNNEIKEVEDGAFSVSSITSLSQLGWLILDNNRIEKVSKDTLNGLPFLRYLGLSKNRINSVDNEAFYHSTNLITIDLEHNYIPAIDEGTFKTLNTLVKLNLGSNMLTEIEANTFTGLDHLVDLYLQDNKIEHLSMGSLIPLINVRQLMLQQNTLRCLDMSMFAGMFNLRHVDASNNNIQEVTPAEGIPTALNELNLSNNQIISLAQTISQSLTANGKVHLANNPWRCTCELTWLPAAHMNGNIRFVDDSDTLCSRPNHLNGKQVFSMTAYELCNLDGFIIPSTAQMETQATKPTTAAPTVKINTTQKKVKTTSKDYSTTMHAADMPMGTMPAMPKLLCDEHHQRNRTYRGKKLLVNWHVSVLSPTTREILCTGARLDTDWFILPASCTVDKLNSKLFHTYRAVIGTVDLNNKAGDAHVRTMQKVTIHPEFTGKPSTRYDIALVQLNPLGMIHQVYSESPCIMSKGDLEKSIATFKVGRLTTTQTTSSNTVKVALRRNKLAPKLCSSGTYMCSRFKNTQEVNFNLLGAPIYIRHGIGDSDWALSALNTAKSRLSKSGKSLVHKHLPLYAHVNWFQHVMEQEARWLAQMH